MIIMQSILIFFTNNPIVAILCLISVYILTSIYFFILGAEFIAIVLIIVYVGAISILFIFVVMLLNVRLITILSNRYKYFMLFGFFLGIFISLEFYYVLFFDLPFFSIYYLDYNPVIISWVNLITYKSNLHNLAIVFFNYYYYLLIFAALILLLAMIGAIALTIDSNYNNKFFLNKSTNLRFFSARVKKNRISFWQIKKKKNKKIYDI